MTKDELEKAKQLHEKIENLSSFIFLASRGGFWEKIVFKKELRLFTSVHGFNENDGYRLDKELTLKVIEVLELQVKEWEQEFEEI